MSWRAHIRQDEWEAAVEKRQAIVSPTRYQLRQPIPVRMERGKVWCHAYFEPTANVCFAGTGLSARDARIDCAWAILQEIARIKLGILSALWNPARTEILQQYTEEVS